MQKYISQTLSVAGNLARDFLEQSTNSTYKDSYDVYIDLLSFYKNFKNQEINKRIRPVYHDDSDDLKKVPIVTSGSMYINLKRPLNSLHMEKLLYLMSIICDRYKIEYPINKLPNSIYHKVQKFYKDQETTINKTTEVIKKEIDELYNKIPLDEVKYQNIRKELTRISKSLSEMQHDTLEKYLYTGIYQDDHFTDILHEFDTAIEFIEDLFNTFNLSRDILHMRLEQPHRFRQEYWDPIDIKAFNDRVNYMKKYPTKTKEGQTGGVKEEQKTSVSSKLRGIPKIY